MLKTSDALSPNHWFDLGTSEAVIYSNTWNTLRNPLFTGLNYIDWDKARWRENDADNP